MAIEYRVPWKDSSARFQYGLNTPDGLNMVVRMVEDTLQQNGGMDHWLWMEKMHSMPPEDKPF